MSRLKKIRGGINSRKSQEIKQRGSGPSSINEGRGQLGRRGGGTFQGRKLFAEIQYLKKLVGYLHLTSTTEQTCNLEWAFVSQNIGNSEILGVPNSLSPGNPGKYCSLAIPIIY